MEVGTEPGTALDVGDGTAVKALNAGLAAACVTAGESPPSGVDACSVANRSGVGGAAELTRPHPRIKNKPTDINKSLALDFFQFD
jgi:hypothetical protein